MKEFLFFLFDECQSFDVIVIVETVETVDQVGVAVAENHLIAFYIYCIKR